MPPYFSLRMADEERWTLTFDERFSEGTAVDVWAYRRCQLVPHTGAVPLRVYSHGKAVDYSPTPFGTIVVSRRFAEIAQSVASTDIQRIPAHLDQPGEWEILNVLSCIDCISRERSVIQYFPANHPTRANDIRGVLKLVIDSRRALEHEIFLPTGWEVETIVSDKVRAALLAGGVTGVEFVQVS